MKRSKKKRGRKIEAPWTPFARGWLSPEQVAQINACGPNLLPDAVFVNARYEVWIRKFDSPIGEMLHLSVKRRDREPVRDWRDMQRIKNELVAPEREAVELYPAESRLVDTANQYHLWVLGPEQRFPFGYEERLVMGPDDPHPFVPLTSKAKQRAFEPAGGA